MKKRILWWGGLGLFLALGIALAIPACRYPLLGFLGIQRQYNGRPIAYWIAALKDDDTAFRRQAALALGDAAVTDRPDDEIVIAALIEGLGDGDGFVRKCAATSFLMYPLDMDVPQDSMHIALMIGACGMKKWRCDKPGCERCGRPGRRQQENGVARLSEALADKDFFVRAYACRALARIGPDAQASVPMLLKRLREDEDRDIRKLAAKSLGLIGPQAVGPLLPETVQALTAGLKDKLRGFREYSARALGQLGAKEAIPALRQAAGDRDARVRDAVAEALKRLESE